ncbi:hypothetical protein EDB19DRAFT_1914433 [Suillus lakei]|nr:hypothetical protein EDB19DRAFT_1914433 [Suillus lakei]
MSSRTPCKRTAVQTPCIPEFPRLGVAIKRVLSERFPTSDLADPSTACTGYCTQGMSLEDTIVMRHCSHSDEERNRDPDVEGILEHSPGGAGAAELASSTRGYTKTGQLKRELYNYQGAATGSNKKRRVPSMEKADHIALSPRQDSHAPQPVPSAVSNGLASKPTAFITPGMDGIAAPPSLEECSTSASPPTTGRTASTRRKSEGKVKRDARRRKLQRQDRRRKVEEMNSNGDVDALRFRVSTTGWQGTNYASSQEGRVLRKEWYDYSILFRLTEFERVPYQRLKTRVRDSQGRLWLVRTFVGPHIKELLPLFQEAAATFVSTVEQNNGSFSESEMEGHARGRHWFSLCGHDRNSKLKPSLSAWHLANCKAIDQLWTPAGAVSQISSMMNAVFQEEFPLLARRAGVRRVHCSPHVDWKNIAIGICVIFIYGDFNSKERSWLVIWEAGLVIEMPAGVFVMYPSSLFFHFNVDMCDLQFVCTNGSLPTEDNSSRLDGGDGRGSCVWFNQATMFQSAELGFTTVADARRAGAPCTSNASSLIHQGHFPAL